jgi:hypothetical protein
MRIARKLLVVAVLTAATMAFGASSASAVEVSDVAGHCTAVTLMPDHEVEGGCRVEAVSERETVTQAFVSGVGFVTISACEEHVEAAVGEDGTGYIYAVTHVGHEGTPCTRTQCDEANMAKIPWSLSLTSTTNMEYTFCLRTISGGEGAAGTPCHTDIAVTPNNATGAHEVSANGTTTGSCENLGGGVRVITHWIIVPSPSHPAITIAP